MSSFEKEQAKRQAESSAVGEQTTAESSGSAQGAAAQILRLQRQIGNRAVGQMLHLHETAPEIESGGDGRPLSSGVRSLFEERFGEDFSKVRVHTSVSAAESARSFDAVAYTVGHDVVFDAGKFNPQSRQGQHLLAHELAHVVQQSRGGDAPSSFDSSSGLEHAAGLAATEFSSGAGPVSVSGASSPGVARQQNEELPRWKRIWNPVYQKALKVLPADAAAGLEAANEIAKAVVKKAGITDEQLNRLSDVAEPVLSPVQQILSIAPAAEPPAQPPPAKAPPGIKALPKITRPVRTLAFQKFGTFGENLVTAQLAEPSIQTGPNPTAGYNFDTYLVNLATGKTIPAQYLGGTRYRVFMGTEECPGCHMGHGLEVDLAGDNPILATIDAFTMAAGIASAGRSAFGLASRLGAGGRLGGAFTLETAQEWLAQQPKFRPPSGTPPPIELGQTGGEPLQLQTAQEWLAENQFQRPPGAPLRIDLGVKPITPLELQTPQQWLLEPRPIAPPSTGARAPEVILVGSDAPGGGIPFQDPDPALTAPRSYVDQNGRPVMREYIVQKGPGVRGPVQRATSRPFNLLEPNIVHGSHLQARRFLGPDAPSNLIPAPKDINLEFMGGTERDLDTMVDLDQEIYVQQYQRYEGANRIPLDTTYRIFRKFEGSWRLLQEKTVAILH